MSAVVQAGALARLLVRLRAVDRLNMFLALTSGGIAWTVVLSYMCYRNQLTDHRTNVYSMWSYGFIVPWMRAWPVRGPTIKMRDLAGETPGRCDSTPELSAVAVYRQRFAASWEAAGGRASAAIIRQMTPWWVFTHMMQVPRKFVQFLPPLLVSSLLEFLQNPNVPASVGYQLMVLAAARMICDKSSQAHYLFSATNSGSMPISVGCKALVIEKLQKLSPRGRVEISAAEIQTLFAKMESFMTTLSMPGQSRIALDLLSLPIGYFFLYRLFGIAAIVVSIAVNPRRLPCVVPLPMHDSYFPTHWMRAYYG